MEKQSKLAPPFLERSSPIPNIVEIVLPAAVQGKRTAPPPMLDPASDMQEFLKRELCTPRLDHLYDYLWLAGLPVPARPLHRQKIVGRKVFITENPDEHLVWHQTTLLLKPLPDFLLSHEFWTEHLAADADLHRGATGLLLSYAWLIGHRSDLALAQEAHLVPEGLGWREWTAFIGDVLSRVDQVGLEQASRRYRYGELRLSRLNSMTRYLPLMWSLQNLVHGYISTSTWSQAFFERNFSWLLAVFVYISVILSAMQVGLATPPLSDNAAFGNLSYGIALVSIAAVLLGIAAMLFAWLTLFSYHLLSTLAFDRYVRKRREGQPRNHSGRINTP